MATETLRPNAAGDECNIETQVGCSACPNHYDCVDEVTADDFTTFIRQRGEVSSAWTRDLYNIENSIGGGSDIINSVKVYARMKETGELQNASSFKLVVKSGATVDEGTLQTCGTGTWTTYSDTWTINPDTGNAWTWAEIDSMQAGLTVSVPYNGSSETLTITQVYVEVDSTPRVFPVPVADGDLIGIGIIRKS